MIKKFVVISLADSPRLEGFQKSNWGLEFEVFDAIDTRQGHVPDDFNIDEYRKRTLKDPRPAEVGCAISHYRVIKEFAEQEGEGGDFMLVAEDDARAVAGFSEKLNNILATKGKKDIVVLSEPIFGSMKNLKYYAMSLMAKNLPGGYRMGHYADRLAGAGLYLISRESCIKYVAQVKKAGGVSWVADEYNVSPSATAIELPFHVLDVQVVRPGLADWEGETTIHDIEGYNQFKQWKLAEHSISVSGVMGLMEKVKSKVNVNNIRLIRDLLIVSAKDLGELLSKKNLR
ncbi:glycosyltransferase family 25 protein [Rothia sp. 11254D007CT]